MLNVSHFVLALTSLLLYSRHLIGKTEKRFAHLAPHSKPFVVNLRVRKGNKYFRCGGTILDRTTILTAAHCLGGANEIRIMAGKHNLDEDGAGAQIMESTSFVHHEKWLHEFSRNYDIGIIHLPSPLNWTQNVSPIEISSEQPTANSVLEALGWGKIDNSNYSNELKAIKNHVLPPELHQCQGQSREKCDSSHSICLDSDSGTVCEGDSGGPLLNKNNELVGIASFASDKCEQELYQCFTSVIFFRQWISDHVTKFT